MRFVRSRVGLILWMSVWLLVALVPTWRVRMVRSLSGAPSFLFDGLWLHSYGLTPELEDEAARRFPNDAAAQFTPLSGLHYSQEEHNTTAHTVPNISSPTLRPTPDPREAKRQRHDDEYFGRYDSLLRRFPDANFGRIQRLRDFTIGAFNIDQGPLPPGESHLSSENNRPAWFSQSQRETALRVAEEGALHEPDNAFFPWMQAVLLFSLRRDNEGIAALERAGKCARFDDGIPGTVARRILLLRRLKTSTWEDEETEAWSVLLPHLAPIHTVASAVAGRMRLARQQGNEARALELAGVLQRAGAAMTHTNGVLITRLVGQAICQTAWSATIENEPKQPKMATGANDGSLLDYYAQRNQRYSNELAARFAAHARANGRSDLGSEAEKIALSFNGQQIAALYRSPYADTLETRAEQMTRAALLQWTVGSLSLAAALTWLVMWAISARAPVVLKRVSAGALVTAMFCAGISVPLVAAAAMYRGNSPFQSADNPNATLPVLLKMVVNNTALLLALVWVLPPVAATLRSQITLRWPRLEKRGFDTRRLVYVALVGGLLGGGLLGVFAGSAPFRSTLTDVAAFVGMILVLGCALAGSSLWIVWAQGRARISALCCVGALWLLAMGFLSSAIQDSFWGSLVVVVAVALLLVSCWPWRGYNMVRFNGIKNFVVELAARTRIAAATLALFCALGYLGIALWTTPMERSARTFLDRQLQVGEVEMLREQLKKNLAPQ